MKWSLLLVFTTFAVVISINWDWLDRQYFALASILAWGVGDALAALIGKKYGKTKNEFRFLDDNRSN